MRILPPPRHRTEIEHDAGAKKRLPVYDYRDHVSADDDQNGPIRRTRSVVRPHVSTQSRRPPPAVSPREIFLSGLIVLRARSPTTYVLRSTATVRRFAREIGRRLFRAVRLTAARDETCTIRRRHHAVRGGVMGHGGWGDDDVCEM